MQALQKLRQQSEIMDQLVELALAPENVDTLTLHQGTWCHQVTREARVMPPGHARDTRDTTGPRTGHAWYHQATRGTRVMPPGHARQARGQGNVLLRQGETKSIF